MVWTTGSPAVSDAPSELPEPIKTAKDQTSEAEITPEVWDRLPHFIKEDTCVLRSRVKPVSDWDASQNQAQHERNRPYWLKQMPVWK